jgi:hypothetical protein
MKISEEQREYFARHREEGHPRYEPALRCPNCGGTDFFYTEVSCLPIKKEK